MAYINFRFSSLFILCLVLVLGGCSTSPRKKAETEDNTRELDAELTAALQDESFTPLPDPYLQQDVSVDSSIRQAFEEALVVMQKEDWPQAERQFLALTQSAPALSGPWVNIGICRWRQDQIAGAKEAFEQAIELNALNGDAYNTYAVLAREQGEFTQAEALYQKALTAWPHNEVSHRNLGILYDMYMGRLDDALKHFEISAKINGNPDKKLRGWIIDIKRRQAKAARDNPSKDSSSKGQQAEPTSPAVPETSSQQTEQNEAPASNPSAAEATQSSREKGEP